MIEAERAQHPVLPAVQRARRDPRRLLCVEDPRARAPRPRALEARAAHLRGLAGDLRRPAHPRRALRRARPQGLPQARRAPDASAWNRGRLAAGQAASDDEAGRAGPGGGGPRPPPVSGARTEPALGRRHHLRADLGGLPVPRDGHRRLEPSQRWLVDARRPALGARARRARDGRDPAQAAGGRHPSLPIAAARADSIRPRNARSRGVAMGEKRRAADRAGRPAMRSPGRPPVGRLEHRQRFWAAIARGLSSEDAAVQAGVSAAVGVRWFRAGGGMPSVTLVPASGRYLSFAEREEIAVLRAGGRRVREIARQLGRSPSTISRELRRNAATRGGVLEYRAHDRPVARRHAGAAPQAREARREPRAVPLCAGPSGRGRAASGRDGCRWSAGAVEGPPSRSSR